MTLRVTSVHHFLEKPHEDWHLNTDVGLQDCGRKGRGALSVDRFVELLCFLCFFPIFFLLFFLFLHLLGIEFISVTCERCTTEPQTIRLTTSSFVFDNSTSTSWRFDAPSCLDGSITLGGPD